MVPAFEKFSSLIEFESTKAQEFVNNIQLKTGDVTKGKKLVKSNPDYFTKVTDTIFQCTGSTGLTYNINSDQMNCSCLRFRLMQAFSGVSQIIKY